MPTVLRSLLLVLLAAAGFTLVAEGMSRMIPMPNFLGHWSKWEYFKRNQHEIEAVWLGTSHVARNIDNPAIEAALAERGLELEMFNFGIPGMGAYEQDYMLNMILSLEPEALRYVFIESGPIAMGVHPRHIFRGPTDNDTQRSVMWHTARQTRKVLEQVPLLPISWIDRVDHAFEHARLLCRNFSSYGLGREIKRGLRGVSVEHDWLVETKGFRTWASTHPDQVERSAAFVELAAELGETGLIQQTPPDALATHTDCSGLNVAFYREQQALAERHGVRLVYVTMPGSMVSSERPVLAREGVLETLWEFNRPDLYPELFEVRHRWDSEHLNQAGIDLLTPLVVERIAALLGEE